MSLLKTNHHKGVKAVDVVELSFAVPQDQVNELRQLVFRYVLDHNKEDVAFKLLELTSSKLRDDLKIWSH